MSFKFLIVFLSWLVHHFSEDTKREKVILQDVSFWVTKGDSGDTGIQTLTEALLKNQVPPLLNWLRTNPLYSWQMIRKTWKKLRIMTKMKNMTRWSPYTRRVWRYVLCCIDSILHNIAIKWCLRKSITWLLRRCCGIFYNSWVSQISLSRRQKRLRWRSILLQHSVLPCGLPQE